MRRSNPARLPLQSPPYDPERAIELAERIWWVGSYLADDPFQCHAYLIENGDESILIDPGSPLTFAETRRKIEAIIPFHHVRYLVCQHQDPDIVAAISLVDDDLFRSGAVIVTHWRTAALIRHYGWKVPIRSLDDQTWELHAGSRVLKFIPTPYLHSPGAICTLDEQTGVLFSSDLFGGFTTGFTLVAHDETYFEAMRPFHEHYMPSSEILQFGLDQIERHPVRMIAPQHGSVIPEHLVGTMISKLKTLECGLLASAPGRANVARLSRLNHVLSGLRRAASVHCRLNEMVHAMFAIIHEVVPEVRELVLWALDAHNQPVTFSERSQFRPSTERPLRAATDLLGRNGEAWAHHTPSGYRLIDVGEEAPALLMPLLSDECASIGAVLMLHLDAFPVELMELRESVKVIAQPLRVAIERELLMHSLDQDKRRYYLQAIRDSLTGLYSRMYMEDEIGRMVDRHARNQDAGFGIVLVDIDRFKRINDAYGHLCGDEVLRKVAELILSECRTADIPVRFGGDEFAVFLADFKSAEGFGFAERVRLAAQKLRFSGVLDNISVSLSAGFVGHIAGESLENLIRRADLALYQAKREGRDRVCIGRTP